jgi:uncharacterized phage-associated protein
MNEMDLHPTKLQSLILYIVQNLHRELGGIELAKIIYLIDVEMMRNVGRTITGESYSRAPNGPLAHDFSCAINTMLGFEITIREEQSKGYSGINKNCHILGDDPRFKPELDDLELLFAHKVLKEIGQLSPIQLENLAYETEPMKAIVEEEKTTGQERGKVLNLSLINQNPAYRRWRENISKPQKRDPEYEQFLESEALEIDELITMGD